MLKVCGARRTDVCSLRRASPQTPPSAWPRAGAAGAAATSAPRLLVVLGKGASGALVEEFAGAGPVDAYFCNAVAEVVLAEDSQLVHGCAAAITLRGPSTAFRHRPVRLRGWALASLSQLPIRAQHPESVPHSMHASRAGGRRVSCVQEAAARSRTGGASISQSRHSAASSKARQGPPKPAQRHTAPPRAHACCPRAPAHALRLSARRAAQVCAAGGARRAAHEGDAGRAGRAQRVPPGRGAPGRAPVAPGPGRRAGAPAAAPAAPCDECSAWTFRSGVRTR